MKKKKEKTTHVAGFEVEGKTHLGWERGEAEMPVSLSL